MALVMARFWSLLVHLGTRVERTVEAIYDREMDAIEHRHLHDR
jgi:hypothetical protein